MTRKVSIDVAKYGRLMEKYFKEDLSDLFGVDITDAPEVSEAQEMLMQATDPVLADDIVDGAARWYAYKTTVRIQQALKRGEKL